MHNKLLTINEKLFKLLHPQGQIIDVKCGELLITISNKHNKFEQDTVHEKLFKLSRPQGQIIKVKGEKSQ